MKKIQTCFQLAIIWLLFLGIFPALLRWGERMAGLEVDRFGQWPIIGAVLLGLGTMLGLGSAVVKAVHGHGTGWTTFCPRRLVVAGPYRFVRNPLVLASFIQGIGIGLYFGSPGLLVYVVAALVLWNFTMRRWEEAEQEQRFGEAYCLYRRRVGCWQPRLRAYDPAREGEEPPLAAERTTPPGHYVVLYDGYCRFCTEQVKHLMALARPGVMEKVNFQDPIALARFPGVSHAACMRAMQLVTPAGRVYSGFEAAVQAVATRPILGLVAYTYYVPGIRLALDLLYALVAAQRYRLMGKAVAAGACDGGTCSLHARARSWET